MRIAMIGTGYVGLVSGACLADFGHKVTCVDKDARKIEGLDAGGMPIWEPGLEALVKANAERGRLTFTTDLEAGVAGAEAIFIAVGTPARRGDGHADLTYVFEAIRELAKVIKPGTVVVTKSTVPVGTGDKISEILAEEGVRSIFGELGRPPPGEQDRRLVEEQWPVDFAQDLACFLVLGADHDPVGNLEVADRRALAQEFGVRCDRDPFGAFLGENFADLIAGADRDSRLHHENDAFETLRQLLDHRPDGRQVRVARRGRNP